MAYFLGGVVGMATLIPPLNGCLPRMTSGEKRFAQRLEAKLEDDYLLWYDVPEGNSGFHPDFIVMHPHRGILILEVKDWRINTIQKLSKTRATILTSGGAKEMFSPLEQARIYAHSSKGLEFPVVAIPGIGYLPNTHGELKDEVRLMYVGMTRAMDQLILTGHQDSTFGEMLARVV